MIQSVNARSKPISRPSFSDSIHFSEKLLDFDVRVTERPFQRITVHFVAVGENDYSAVGVLHLHMAALAVNSHKAQALQCRQDLSPRQQWQLHIVSSTISRPA